MMQIELFSIPVFGSELQVEEMNKFLRAHKIIDIERRFVELGSNSFWSLMIRYIEGEQFSIQGSKKKIDYKDELAPQIFAKFTILREIRKELAIRKNVPIYTFFSNDELAKIAELDEISIPKVLQIKGIGEKKMQNFGNEIVQMYVEHTNQNSNSSSSNA